MSIASTLLGDYVMRPLPVSADMATEILSRGAVPVLMELSSLLEWPQSSPEMRAVVTIVGRASGIDLPNNTSKAPAEALQAALKGGAPLQQYRVEAAGRQLLLFLRGNYSAGDQVRIVAQNPQFPGRSPVAAEPAAGAPAAAANADLAARALARAGQPTPPELSPDAQRFGALLQRIESVVARAVFTLPANASAAAEPPTAAALAQAVSESGLFYESHLAQWVQGQRSTAAVLREAGSRADLPAGAATALHAHDAAAQLAAQVPGPLLPVIKQQLDTVDAGRFTMHGLVWTGQPAEISIGREPPDSQGGAGAPPAAAVWSARLKLQLPTLGQIDATLSLQGNNLQLALAAEQPSDPALRPHLADLAASLKARGLTLAPVRMEALDGSA